MPSGYRTDLAYVHDVGFTGFVSAAAPGLLRLLQRNGVDHGLVIDLGCGSGRWAAVLTRAGYQVVGIDASPSMIRLARTIAPRARFRVASLFQASLPRCAAVTSIGECLNYAFDPRAGWRSIQQLFGRVHDALLPGGVFIFDVAEPGQVPAGTVQHTHRTGQEWATLVDAKEDSRRHILTRRITTFRKRGGTYRRSEETHRLRLYPAKDLARALREREFKVERLHGYGNCRLLPHRVAFLAKKA